MIKITCLVDPQRKVGTPQKLGLESPRRTAPAQRYLSRSEHKQSINKMPQTCVIGNAKKERGSDCLNFDEGITKFGVVVEKL
jgi:hypothetical protein